jgi:hypothetical protein
LELVPTALVAATANVATPIAVGVPLTTPVEAFKIRPAGSEPLVTDQVMGVVPEAAKVCEYGVPTTAAVKGEAVVIETEAITVRPSCVEALPNELVALTVNVKVPEAVGVPPMTPVAAFNVNPVGKVPPVTDHVMGEVPEALRVWE